MPRFPLLFLFVVALHQGVLAQVPFYTKIDTAHMREMHERKIMYQYTLEQPFDSITGKLKTKTRFDTTYTLFDRAGRELDFSYANEDGSRSHGRYYYDSLGRVVRHFSYDTDSTNGFLDYWTYNERGQVIQEVACTREGTREVAFAAKRFSYDDSGNLVVQKSYMVDDEGSETLEDISHFYYPSGTITVEIGLHEGGDTSFVDTTYSDDRSGEYYSHRYSYLYKRRLVSNSDRSVDSLGARIKTTYHSEFYNYSDGKLKRCYSDTTLADRNDNILESRSDQYIDKYFYDNRGEFEYMIRYNRLNQPLFRRTTAFEYYP